VSRKTICPANANACIFLFWASLTSNLSEEKTKLMRIPSTQFWLYVAVGVDRQRWERARIPF
jgi:hypothetical protein